MMVIGLVRIGLRIASRPGLHVASLEEVLAMRVAFFPGAPNSPK